MKKFYSLLFLLCLFLAVIFGRIVFLKNVKAAPKTCGNGVCQISLSEDCNSCPVDCGSCEPPTPTPAPTAVPTTVATPVPTVIPTVIPTTVATPVPTVIPSSTPTTGVTVAPTTAETTPTETSDNTNEISEIVTSISDLPNYINSSNLNLSGNASVSLGKITNILFTYDNGSNWYNAVPTDNTFNDGYEEFTLFSPNLDDGDYSLEVRVDHESGTYSKKYQIKIVSLPPQINLTTDLSEAISDQSPVISGVIIGGTDVRAQISFDGGLIWYGLTISNSKFSFIRKVEFEDGNYQVLIRASDLAGNVITKDVGELIIDTIPPIIGGNLISIGVQELGINNNGLVKTTTNVRNKITIGAQGGATNILGIVDKNKEFKFNKIPLTNLWQSEIIFDSSGLKNVEIVAYDGVKNEVKRNINEFWVIDEGKIVNSITNKAIENAEVEVYIYDPKNHKWLSWQSSIYSQNNPQKTNKEGGYSFVLPSGKYYLEARSDGFKRTQSQIFSLSKTTVISEILPLIPKKINNLLSPPFSVQLDLNEDIGKEMATPFYIGKNIKEYFPDLELQNTGLDVIVMSTWSPLALNQIRLLDNDKTLVIFSQISKSEINSFMTRGGYSFKYLIDRYGEIGQELGINTFPHHLLIDKDGLIRDYRVGVLQMQNIFALLDNFK